MNGELSCGRKAGKVWLAVRNSHPAAAYGAYFLLYAVQENCYKGGIFHDKIRKNQRDVC